MWHDRDMTSEEHTAKIVWPGSIAAITLFVEDLETAKQVYQDVFQLPVFFEDENSAVFKFGETLVNLLRASEAPGLIAPAPVAASATVRALPNWEETELTRPDGRVLRATGVPAQHGPDGTQHIVGEVTGFVLEADDLPRTYVSGDNASLNVVQAVADRLGPVDVAILFAGAAKKALVPDGYLTLTSEAAARAAEILSARAVVPVHFEGWTHFTQGRDTLVTAFERAGLSDRLHLLEPGGSIDL